MDKKQQELHIIKVLGRGAFGEVQLVKNEIGMEFALKKVNIGNKTDIDNAQQEAMAMFKLNHKNIVRFQQVFKDEHGLSILMEYAAGGSLYDKVVEANKKGEHLSEAQILKWTGQLANALSYLHKKNIIHRDIKPQNVLLDSEGVLKLADLGISRVLENTLGNAQTFAGTKAYMSPEILDEEPYDCKVDIWSLGIMLYQLLTFQLPFKKVSDQIKGNYIPLPASISPIFQELIKMTLVVDPKKRASAKEIRSLIKESPLAKELSPKKALTAHSISEDMSTLRINASTTVSQPEILANYQNDSTFKAGDDSSKFEKGLDSALVKSARAKWGNFNMGKFPEDGIPREFKEWTKFVGEELYQGEVRKGTNVPHGRGIKKWVDGSVYEGFFKNGKAEPRGRLYHSDGDIFEGDWIADKANGQGAYIHADGAKYVGAWKDDKQHGYGTETWPDGAKYEGDYINGTKHGKGGFYYADGSSYVGGFDKNNIHGSGTYKWIDGRVYTGDWKNGAMNGKGVCTWPDDRKYEGEYVNDQKHGQGTFFWPNGNKYIGPWVKGKQHGIGTYVDSSGAKKGEWNEGQRTRWLN